VTGFSPLQHEADGLSAGLPPLMVAAERLAASVNLGIHGRRRAGMGESFWQFRRYSNEDAARIDWRQSAKSQHLYVREREWEAAQTVWLWRDGGAGMRFASGSVSKMERAELLLMALAALLIRGGERVGFMGGLERPTASRVALLRITQSLLNQALQQRELPPPTPVARGAELVWLGDFLEPGALDAMRALAHAGVVGHLVRIIDPAEEDFPYNGRARFESVKSRDALLFGRAETIGDAYRARFRAHGEEVAATALKLGWTVTSHRTDHAPLSALIALHAAIGTA
jgi:uncharacterized protein (DUF58 family)